MRKDGLLACGCRVTDLCDCECESDAPVEMGFLGEVDGVPTYAPKPARGKDSRSPALVSEPLVDGGEVVRVSRADWRLERDGACLVLTAKQNADLAALAQSAFPAVLRGEERWLGIEKGTGQAVMSSTACGVDAYDHIPLVRLWANGARVAQEPLTPLALGGVRSVAAGVLGVLRADLEAQERSLLGGKGGML